MKKTAELVKKCQERMKSIRDNNYFTLRFGKTKMYSEKPFKKINMKQTAVEWYNSKVIELMTQREQGNIDVLEFRNQLDLLLEQAKEMEKEQIIDAVNFGDERGKITTYSTAEQYYNETFKPYCMPEGLDTPEKHEQYLKDIGLINNK